MYRQVLLTFLMLIGSEIALASQTTEVARRKENGAIIQQIYGTCNIHFNGNGNGIYQQKIAEKSIPIQRDPDLEPCVKCWLCFSESLYDSCKPVCNKCKKFDCLRTIDDWGYCPVICCTLGISWWTGNPCVAVSTIGACGLVARCVAPCTME